MHTIKTARLLLRPFTMDDLMTTHEYAGDAEHTKYMMFLPNGTIQETERFLLSAITEIHKDSPEFFEFAVTLDGQHIGAVSIFHESAGTYELGWIFHRGYEGFGYATEAAKAVLDYSVNTLRAHKIIAHCDQRNTASRRVMEKIGLILESSDGKRKNKGAAEESGEYMYSLTVG